MAKFKKKLDYVEPEPDTRQEILAEEMQDPVVTPPPPADPFELFDIACTNMTATLDSFRDTVSSSLIDETILHINTTLSLTHRVKVKLG